MFEHFYYEAIRKTVIAFGTLFNSIYIKHKNKSGEVVSTLKVPFAYGPTQKFLARLEQSPDLNKKIQITTPRISMEIVGLTYDASRKSSTMRGFLTKDSNGPRKSYLPVPYNVNFELSIFTKLEDDMFQIVEQIIPYFQPQYTITITAVEEIQEKRDIIFTLDNISMTDNYEGNFDDRRALIWTLKFTAKTYIFLPISSDSVENSIINRVTIGFVAGDVSNTVTNDIDISVTPKAVRNYTGTVVTTLSSDASIEDRFITVSDSSNLTVKTLIEINGEIMYVETIDQNKVQVIRGLYDTSPQLQVSGSNLLNITTIDNNLIPVNDILGFVSTFE